jgi:translation initiation factor IF-2
VVIPTVLVQAGTLNVGDMVVAGPYYGKVKAMLDYNGKKTKSAGPSVPVQLLGLNGAPQAGEKFKVFDNEQDAKALATNVLKSTVNKVLEQRNTLH